MAAKKKQTDTFETHLASLEAIVEALESGDLDPETAMTRYEEGVKRLKTCYGMLQEAEQRVRKLVTRRRVRGGVANAPRPPANSYSG